MDTELHLWLLEDVMPRASGLVGEQLVKQPADLQFRGLKYIAYEKDSAHGDALSSALGYQ